MRKAGHGASEEMTGVHRQETILREMAWEYRGDGTAVQDECLRRLSEDGKTPETVFTLRHSPAEGNGPKGSRSEGSGMGGMIHPAYQFAVRRPMPAALARNKKIDFFEKKVLTFRP